VRERDGGKDEFYNKKSERESPNKSRTKGREREYSGG